MTYAVNKYCVQIKAVKRADNVMLNSYFNTWEEAHAFLIKRCEIEIKNSEDRLKSAKRALRKARSLLPKATVEGDRV